METKTAAARRNAGLTQTQAAGVTGLDYGTIVKLDQGTRAIENSAFKNLCKLAVAYNARWEDLISDPETLDLLAAIRAQEEDRRNVVK